MIDILSYVSIISFFLAAFILSRIVKPSNRIEAILAFFLFFSFTIVTASSILSINNSIGNYYQWALISFAYLVIVLIAGLLIQPMRKLAFKPLSLPYEVEGYISKTPRDFMFNIIIILSVVTCIIFIINFAICIMLEPANLDAFDYHLARIAFYLQNGSMRYFEANYWNQVIYPKVSTSLQLFTYLMSGKLMNMASLPQFFSSIISVAAIYGICRQFKIGRKPAFFASLLFSCLTIVITEAASPQNDLLLTAFAAITIYFMVAFKYNSRLIYLILAILAVSLMIGVKFTFLLAMPSFLILLMFIIPKMNKISHWVVSILSILLFTFTVIIPAGYGENYKLFKDPLGPKEIRQQYTTEGAPTIGKFIKVGAFNIARYSVQALSTAEMRAIPGWHYVDDSIIYVCKSVLTAIGLDLESDYGSKFKFSYLPKSLANENISQFGVLGIILIWPAILIALFHKKVPKDIKIISLCAFCYYFVQGISTPYDHFHGRYLMVLAIFASPAVAWIISRSNKWYFSIVLIFALASSFSSAFFRNGTNIFPYKDADGRLIPSMFMMDRMSQLTREAPALIWTLDEIENMPEDAVVGVDYPLINYLFFGDKLSRHIVPLVPYSSQTKPLPLPAGLDFLICIDESPYQSDKDKMIMPKDKYFGVIYMRDLRNSK